MPMRLAAMVTLMLALAGCCRTGPHPGLQEEARFDPYSRLRWDDQSEYRIQPAGHGFTVHVYYPLRHTQLDPGVETYIRQTALDIAKHHADEQNKTLAPLKPADVRIAPLRNRFTAVMSWHATVDATFQ